MMGWFGLVVSESYDRLDKMSAKAPITQPKKPWWQDAAAPKPCATPLKPGDRCPHCGGELAYNGLFILVCKACGAVLEGGTFS